MNIKHTKIIVLLVICIVVVIAPFISNLILLAGMLLALNLKSPKLFIELTLLTYILRLLISTIDLFFNSFLFSRIFALASVFAFSISYAKWKLTDLFFERKIKFPNFFDFVIIAPIIGLFTASFFKYGNLAPLRILRIGYDNVAHLALANQISECGIFLMACSNRLNALPSTYYYYPTGWHVLFPVFESSVEGKIWQYLFSYFAQFLITHCVLKACLQEFKGTFAHLTINNRNINELNKSKTKRKEEARNRALFSNLIFGFIEVFMFSFLLMGYVNFVLAIVFLIYCNTNRTYEYPGNLLKYGFLILIGLIYSLAFLPIIWFICVDILKNESAVDRKISLRIPIVVITTFVMVGYIYLNTVSTATGAAGSETSGSWVLYLPTLLLASIYLMSNENNFHQIHLYFLSATFGLQLLVFLSGNLGGYFVFKLFIITICSSVFVPKFLNTTFATFCRFINSKNKFRVHVFFILVSYGLSHTALGLVSSAPTLLHYVVAEDKTSIQYNLKHIIANAKESKKYQFQIIENNFQDNFFDNQWSNSLGETWSSDTQNRISSGIK